MTRPDSPKGRGLLRLAVAGAVAVGATFAVAGTANAAPDSAWDKLAQCESGGNWKINTGNGYYGGLQFNPRTWRAHGGQGMPHQASREQQIAVAERVLASQGWNAWPSCSRKMGLRGHSASPASARVAAATPAPAVAAVAVTKNGADYTVAAGDTLSRIAAAQNVPGGWQALFERNRDVLSNPNVLKVGQQLDLR
ncbi:transglycosylase [Pseudonocardia sp. CNS-139]|nr:transglycosylase [Pseudonocardia sp. CNS-139]